MASSKEYLEFVLEQLSELDDNLLYRSGNDRISEKEIGAGEA